MRSRPRAPRVAAGTTRLSGDIRPVKDSFAKASLVAHVAGQSSIEPKAAKAVLSTLESTMLSAVHKRGAGECTLSGLIKIAAQAMPAKKRCLERDPFTGEDRWFIAGPASVRVKVRASRKLKDAAA